MTDLPALADYGIAGLALVGVVVLVRHLKTLYEDQSKRYSQLQQAYIDNYKELVTNAQKEMAHMSEEHRLERDAFRQDLQRITERFENSLAELSRSVTGVQGEIRELREELRRAPHPETE